MLDYIASFIAPHYCCGCDKIGDLLCDNCKYDITNDQNTYCLICNRPSQPTWICQGCQAPYEKAWVVGRREGVLQRLVGLYKFERAKSAHTALADLILDILPDLPPETVVVPVPTTSARIRERGYDHMLLVARHIAKKRGLKCQQLLKHATATKQRHSSAEQRDFQASKAFEVDSKVDGAVSYLLVDDVITTGATAKYASLALRDAGALHVWVAIIARQTLD